MTMGAIRDLKALTEYAREQVETADVLLAAHEAAELGLCRCGRPHPCDERRQGVERRDYYAQIVGDAS
ncbi:hypothetical protein C5N14_02405 [Micromonospora sp. MW-13]|uniref:hypothetical protein n=1 Tax=Micromonospora sp. MW-13 TaxID=2094022 RepID=UPI000E435934|nr:hypothetical protein [Micromonospora sp. MW-13]RGC70702.1 hypothetical protein C5N14_02405 [Micromonospora sp. MW-13]